jgi:hypothetical protein
VRPCSYVPPATTAHTHTHTRARSRALPDYMVPHTTGANNENSWRSQPPPYPDQSDLTTQARMIKAASKNRTKVFVYRQGQGAGSPAGRQATELLTDPIYDGFFLKSVGGAGALPAGTRVGGTFDFRNQTLVDYFINKYVGGPDCIANPHIDGAAIRMLAAPVAPHPPTLSPAWCVCFKAGLPMTSTAWDRLGRRIGPRPSSNQVCRPTRLRLGTGGSKQLWWAHRTWR